MKGVDPQSEYLCSITNQKSLCYDITVVLPPWKLEKAEGAPVSPVARADQGKKRKNLKETSPVLWRR
jgi:hypothetical protein